MIKFMCIVTVTFAQQTTEENKHLFLSTSVGYGTENNWGNTAFYAGIAISKPLSKKITIETGLTYFTTAIYNVYKAKPTFYANEERYYNATFLNLNAQYVIGNKQSLINAKLKVGPAAKYHDFKILRRAKVYYNGPAETYKIIPGTEIYELEERIGLSLYTAVNFDAKVTSKLRMGIYLDAYSGLIPFEFFMPGIYATFKF